MAAGQHVIAVDLGATSGRVIRVGFDGNALTLEDTNRFANTPVYAGGTLYWDALRLWQDIQTGIDAARAGAVSIGLDCWGVDWALLDRNGKLLSNPVHYRDSRTDGMYEWVFERVPRRTIFERTGLQFMIINGLYSLASLVRDENPILGCAATFLPLADLFNYWLTGNRVAEFTQATTEQMYNPRTAGWDFETLAALDIPTHIFPQVVQPGTRIGRFRRVQADVHPDRLLNFLVKESVHLRNGWSGGNELTSGPAKTCPVEQRAGAASLQWAARLLCIILYQSVDLLEG